MVVHANGTGFPANSTVVFTFDGSPLASACASDANGSFPGTSGTPCTFTVPSAPAGGATVVASTGLSSAQVGVGNDPELAAYDPAKGEVFVANWASDNVSVINAASDAVVASIGVGRNPTGVAYDPAQGQIFVTNDNSANLSVINDTNNTVVATISVPTYCPNWITYDPVLSEMFVGEDCAHTVLVIADSNDTVVAKISSILAGSEIAGLAYDSGTGEVFEANNGYKTVGVIDAATNSLVTNVTVGSSPEGVAYDPQAGELFVTSQTPNHVSVINDSNDSVVATIPVGTYPGGIAFDSANGQMLVADEGSNNASAISVATNSVVGTFPVGSDPLGVAFDSTNGQAFVVDENSNNVTILGSASASPANATSQFTVGPSLTLSPLSGGLGSTVHAIGTGFAATSAISFTFGGTAVASVCTTDPTGGFPGGSHTACTFPIPTSGGGPQNVIASDGTNSANATYVVTASFGLSPSSGFVGSLIGAAGVGFTPNATITFTFSGTAVTSTCASDSTGDFPGTTGSACTFSVPIETGGEHLVSATDGTHTGNAEYRINGNFSLSPANATVGSTVSATGTGFHANASIGFQLAGQQLVTTCSADATGSFPGTTGTKCAFTVPPAPAGVDPVTAESIGEPVNLSIGVGSAPDGVAYDSGTGQVWVSNWASDNVSVIDGATDGVVASVGVGNEPEGIAYDPGTGQIFVANSGSNNLSVIDDSNDTVVASVSLGVSPVDIAYDSGTGQLFVTESGGSVGIVNDTSDLVVDTITVGGGLHGIAYDSGKGEVWAAAWGPGYVGVISDVNDSVLAEVATGPGSAGSPWAVAYDSGTGQVFVTNDGTSNVTVITDTNNTPVSNPGLGNSPRSIAYNPGANELFAANWNSDNLSVIADSNDTVVASLGVGTNPDGVAYAASVGEIFVVNYGSGNVTVVPTVQGSGSAPLTVGPALRLPATSGSVDVGQDVTLWGNGYGSSLSISSFTFGSFSIACEGATVGSCVGGTVSTAANGSFAAQFLVPDVGTGGTYTVEVTDSDGYQATVQVTVNADPLATVPTAAPPNLDLGQTTTIGVVASFGSGNYTYSWLGLPSGCGGTGASIACAPSVADNYTVSVKVTDSNGVSVTSGPLALQVFADPIVTTPVANLSSGDVDAGQSVTFTTAASLGTGAYATFAWSGLPFGCSGIAASVTCSGADLPTGPYFISVNVTDSNGYTSSSSAELSFIVNADPTVTTPTASHTSIDVGQSVRFSATAGSGSGGYGYLWTGLPSGCTGVTTEQATCVPTTAGSFSIQLQVNDSNHVGIVSAPLAFTVGALPTVSVTANRTAMDVGQSINLTANALLGSGGYTFVWSGLPGGCTGTKATIFCVPIAAGNFSVSVKVTDSNGESSPSSAVATLAVAPPLVASLSAEPGAPLPGQSITFESNTTGGTGPITVTWAFGDGSKGTGATVNHAFSSVGTYEVTTWVNDSAGASVEKTLSVSVDGTSPTTTSAASVPYLDYAALAVVLIVAALAALLFLRKRGTSPPPTAEETGAEPEVASTPEGTEATPDAGAEE
ncbi:MAG: PKD domain-containing protein [Thermoplasmata archaeon]|nr:PKD domain-containing protein [Thermoplasmata archaeon]